jgi:uncharacterized membrane protein
MIKKNRNYGNLIIIIAVIVAIFIILGIFGFGLRLNFIGYNMLGEYNSGFILLFGWILMSAFIIIFLSVGVYWLIKKIDSNSGETK